MNLIRQTNDPYVSMCYFPTNQASCTVSFTAEFLAPDGRVSCLMLVL